MDKRGKQITKTIAYGIIAIVLFVGLFFLTYKERGTQFALMEYDIIVFGDSIMRHTKDEDTEDSVVDRMAELSGKKVFNGALGGTCMSRTDTTMQMAYTKDGLSMVSLARAIYMKDFGVQETIRIRENATEYFYDTVSSLEYMDYDKAEIVFIEQGINDYHAGVPIENKEEPYDQYTYKGALRTSIHYLQEAYPHLRIILVTPTYSWYTVPHQTCEEMNEGGGILEDYVQAQIQVAEEMGVEIIDLYHDFYIHDTWEDYLIYTVDGVHPNELGRDMIASKLVEYLLDNPK